MDSNLGWPLVIVGILLTVLAYGLAYKIGVACLLIGVLILIFGPGRALFSRSPR